MAQFRVMPTTAQNAILSDALRALGDENNRVVIDENIISTRDDLFGWLIENGIIFRQLMLFAYIAVKTILCFAY